MVKRRRKRQQKKGKDSKRQRVQKEAGQAGPSKEKEEKQPEKKYSCFTVLIPTVPTKKERRVERKQPGVRIPHAMPKKVRRRMLAKFLRDVAQHHVARYDDVLPILIEKRPRDTPKCDRATFRLRLRDERDERDETGGTHLKMTLKAMVGKVKEFIEKNKEYEFFYRYYENAVKSDGGECEFCERAPGDIEHLLQERLHGPAKVLQAVQREYEGPLPHAQAHADAYKNQLRYLQDQVRRDPAKFRTITKIVDKCLQKRCSEKLKEKVVKNIKAGLKSNEIWKETSYEELKDKKWDTIGTKDSREDSRAALLRIVFKAVSGHVYGHMVASLTCNGRNVVKVGMSSRPVGYRAKEYRNWERVALTMFTLESPACALLEYNLHKQLNSRAIFKSLKNWNVEKDVTKKEYYVIQNEMKCITVANSLHQVLDEMGCLNEDYYRDQFMKRNTRS